MKISEMAKKELLDHMRSTHEIGKYNSESHAWRRAFQLARANGLEQLEPGCTKCIKAVIEWLERV